MIERQIVDIAVEYETPEGIKQSELEDATSTYVCDGMIHAERWKPDGTTIEWERSFNQDKVVSVDYDWSTEDVERPERDGGRSYMGYVWWFINGIVLGVFMALVYAGEIGGGGVAL